MDYLSIFIIAFLAPFLAYRFLFYFVPVIFNKEFVLRRFTGLNIHHMHLGFIMILIGTLGVLLDMRKGGVLVILGLGLGLIFDEINCRLIIGYQRAKELEEYRETFFITTIVFILTIIIAILLYFL